MRDSVHLVKINKAFLGEGNAYTFAQIEDSNEYRGEDITYAMVFRLNDNGTALDSFPLTDTLVTDREPGTFYSPDQHLFTFHTPLAQVLLSGTRIFLYQDDRYELRLRVKGNLITSTTPVVNDFTIQSVYQDTNIANDGSRASFMNPMGTGYGQYEFNWNSRYDGKRYVLSYRFRYDEVRGNDTLRRSIIQQMVTRVTEHSQD